MSRIGRKPITVPANVKIALKGQEVTVTGPKGTLSTNVHPSIKVTWTESEKSIKLEPASKTDAEAGPFWGTSRALIQNTIQGVVSGYEKTLEVVGVGWTAAVQGPKLKLVVGFANPLLVEIPKGLTVVVEKQIIRVSGADKQMVGQFAAQTRALRKPEPYNGKGIKYTTETIKRKQGKQFGA
ncbi:MAG: 50S ribosomal protein L6 [Phycisphaerales bacterium]|nr:50S ribosomal protein L6 [Phycisphaerales bacterium]